MSCFDGLLALWRGPPAAESNLLLSPTAHGERRYDEDLASNICSLQDEAYEWAREQIVKVPPPEEPEERVGVCSICEGDFRGVACRIPAGVYTSTTTVVHFGCAVAEHERVLVSKRRLYKKRCRRKLHQERWEIVRAKRKPRQRGSADTSATPEPFPARTPLSAVRAPSPGEGSCLQGLWQRSSMLGSFFVDLQRHWFKSWRRMSTSNSDLPGGNGEQPDTPTPCWTRCIGKACRWCCTGSTNDGCRGRVNVAPWHERNSCREVLKSWAEGVQREAAEEAAAEAAKELLGFGDSEAASKNSFLVILRRKGRRLLASFIARRFAEAADVAHGRREKRLVQQGSRGAHLARMTAARRGVRLCKWSHVRRHRAAHRWVHGSTLGSSLIYVFSLVATVYKGTCSMMRGLARFACGLWQGEPLRRDTSTDGLRSSAAARRVRSDAYELACQVCLTMELAYPPARTRLRIMCTHVRGRVGRVRTRDYDPDA